MNANAHQRISARPHDIVLGRGNGIKDHQGNVEFRAILLAHSWKYDAQKTEMKRAFASDVAFIVINGPEVPRRVLRSMDGTVRSCEEVTDQDAIVTVFMHRLREGRAARLSAPPVSPMTDEEFFDEIEYFRG